METAKKGKISINRVVATSFFVDVSDVVMNVVIALVSGSVVMMTQALQGFADLIAAGLLLIGVSRSGRRSTRSHPFGFGKELYFWALMSALIMFGVTATLSVFFGYQRLINPEPVKRLDLAILVLLISLVTNAYAFSLSFRRLLGKRGMGKFWFVFMHSALIETKTTFVLDAMGTLASVLGLLALGFYALTGRAYLDAIGAVSIGIMLYALSLILLVGIKDLVVGKSAPEDIEDKIKKSTLVSKMVKNVLDLRTMYIGPNKLLVNMEVNLKNGLTTDDIEELIDEIKARVKKEVPSVGHIQIELESE